MALLLLCLRVDLASAQAGIPRRIAPELFPEYRGSLTEAQPNRRVPDSEHPRGIVRSSECATLAMAKVPP
jgi:hypothetical protein